MDLRQAVQPEGDQALAFQIMYGWKLAGRHLFMEEIIRPFWMRYCPGPGHRPSVGGGLRPFGVTRFRPAAWTPDGDPLRQETGLLSGRTPPVARLAFLQAYPDKKYGPEKPASPLRALFPAHVSNGFSPEPDWRDSTLGVTG